MSWILHDLPVAEKLQAGVSVSKRNFKKAVHRNRIKRLMREAYRLQKQELKNSLNENQQLAVFFIYIDKELPTQELVSNKINLALKRLMKEVNEAASKNI